MSKHPQRMIVEGTRPSDWREERGRNGIRGKGWGGGGGGGVHGISLAGQTSKLNNKKKKKQQMEANNET